MQYTGMTLSGRTLGKTNDSPAAGGLVRIKGKTYRVDIVQPGTLTVIIHSESKVDRFFDWIERLFMRHPHSHS